MYRIEWIWPLTAIGVVSLPMVPFVGAVLAVVVVLLLAAAILVALVGAIAAPPFLLVRAVRRHRRSGRALPTVIAQPKLRKPSLLAAAGQRAAVPEAPAPVR